MPPAMWSPEGVAKPPRVVPPAMWSLEGLAKPLGAVRSAIPPPTRVVVRAVHNGREKSAVHFCFSGDVPIACSGDVPAVFQRPLEDRRKVA